MQTITITTDAANKIKIPVWRSKTKRGMFSYIASQSVFNPYITELQELELDMHVTYTVRESGYLKDLFISDSKGCMLNLSNKLTFKNGFFKII